MLDPHEFVKLAELVIPLIKLPFSSPRTNMHDVKYYVFIFNISSFIFRKLNLLKIKNVSKTIFLIP